MKVYVIVSNDDYGYENIIGVYRDKAKAEKVARDRKQNSTFGADIEEFELE